MRRTLFAVPREPVPFVYAACTRTIAAREGFGARKRDFRLLRRRNKQLAMEHVRDLSWGSVGGFALQPNAGEA